MDPLDLRVHRAMLGRQVLRVFKVSKAFRVSRVILDPPVLKVTWEKPVQLAQLGLREMLGLRVPRGLKAIPAPLVLLDLLVPKVMLDLQALQAL